MSDSLFTFAVPIVAIGSAIVSTISLILLTVRERKKRIFKELDELVVKIESRNEETRNVTRFLGEIHLKIEAISDVDNFLLNVKNVRSYLEKEELKYKEDADRNRRLIELTNGLDGVDKDRLIELLEENDRTRNYGRGVRLDLLKDLSEVEAMAKNLKASSLLTGTLHDG